MAFVAWILLGVIVGASASLIMPEPGQDLRSSVTSILLGITGAILGGYAGRLLGLGESLASGASWLLPVLAAIALLASYRKWRRSKL